MDLPQAYTPDGTGIVIHTEGIGPKDAIFLDGLQEMGPGRISVAPAQGGRERAYMPVRSTQAAVSLDSNLFAGSRAWYGRAGIALLKARITATA